MMLNGHWGDRKVKVSEVQWTDNILVYGYKSLW